MDLTLIRSFLKFFLISLAIGCANHSYVSGKWSLIVDGKPNHVIVEQLDNSTFYIKSQDLEEISGKYRLEKRFLILVSPEHPRVNKIVFERTENGSWIIINAPPSSRMPVRIIGAKLVR